MQRELSTILLTDAVALGLFPTSNASGRNFSLPEFVEVSCEELVLSKIFYESVRRKAFMKGEMKLLQRRRELKAISPLWLCWFHFFLALLSLLCQMADL